MTQAHNIAKSLKDITAATPDLVTALPGGLHHGIRAALAATPPFGLLEVKEIDTEGNTAGVGLVSYLATLTIAVDQAVGGAGGILAVFNRYWNRVANMNGLDDDVARFVLIHREEADIGEAENEELGVDKILAVGSWTIKLSEHQPELV